MDLFAIQSQILCERGTKDNISSVPIYGKTWHGSFGTYALKSYINVAPGLTMTYEGDPRSNANPSVISSTFGIFENGLHVLYV